MGKLIRNPRMPAPRKFQKPTATRNMTAQRWGNGVRDRDSCRAPSCRKLQASNVRNVRGMTSAEDHNSQGAEQPGGQALLAPWRAARDHRGQEDAGGEERGRRPEDRELHVPGPDDVERQIPGQIEPEEACNVRPV